MGRFASFMEARPPGDGFMPPISGLVYQKRGKMSRKRGCLETLQNSGLAQVSSCAMRTIVAFIALRIRAVACQKSPRASSIVPGDAGTGFLSPVLILVEETLP
jgi:hypothetical protein